MGFSGITQRATLDRSDQYSEIQQTFLVLGYVTTKTKVERRGRGACDLTVDSAERRKAFMFARCNAMCSVL